MDRSALKECHTLIMSDIHLGSRVCKADKVLEVLRNVRFKDLIINGDLFDSNTTYKFNAAHWEIAATIAAIADRHKTIMVGGNHGRDLDALAKKMGVAIYDNHAFSIAGRKFLCLHGDEFDMLVRKFPFTTRVFTEIYYFIQRFGGKKQRVSIFLKRITKVLFGISRRQKRLALIEGAREQADVVICSHTHIPHVDKQGGILFVNSGSFCNDPCNYVTIAHDGKVTLEEI